MVELDGPSSFGIGFPFEFEDEADVADACGVNLGNGEYKPDPVNVERQLLEAGCPIRVEAGCYTREKEAMFHGALPCAVMRGEETRSGARRNDTTRLGTPRCVMLSCLCC